MGVGNSAIIINFAHFFRPKRQRGAEVPIATLVAKILLIRNPYEKFEIGSNDFIFALPKIT